MLVWFFRIALLALIWWCCSFLTEPFFLVMGAFSILLVFGILQRMKLLSREASLMPYLKGSLTYAPWLLKEIYLSSLKVTRFIWQVSPAPKPVLGWIETNLKSPAALTAYGNSITLTPGTICADTAMDKERGLLLVHALEASGFSDLQSKRMEKKLRPRFEIATTKKKVTAWW